MGLKWNIFLKYLFLFFSETLVKNRTCSEIWGRYYNPEMWCFSLSKINAANHSEPLICYSKSNIFFNECIVPDYPLL